MMALQASNRLIHISFELRHTCGPEIKCLWFEIWVSTPQQQKRVYEKVLKLKGQCHYPNKGHLAQWKLLLRKYHKNSDESLQKQSFILDTCCLMDETNIEVYSHFENHYTTKEEVCKAKDTNLIVKSKGGNIVFCGCFLLCWVRYTAQNGIHHKERTLCINTKEISK